MYLISADSVFRSYNYMVCMFVQAEELRKAILGAIDEKLGRKCGTSRDQLRAAVEAIKYEDWAIEFDLVRDF